MPLELPHRDLGWCDDPTSPNYNRPVRLPQRSSCETMRREDHVYDVVLVLDYNLQPRTRARGSAIFFHLSRGRDGPTAGCVAISPSEMRRLLPRLARRPTMLIG